MAAVPVTSPLRMYIPENRPFPTHNLEPQLEVVSAGKIEAIRAKLVERITWTEKAKKYYQSYLLASFEEDKQKIIESVLILTEDKTIYYKLMSILDVTDTNFQFEICAPDEMAKETSGEYNRWANKISFSSPGLHTPTFIRFLESVL